MTRLFGILASGMALATLIGCSAPSLQVAEVGSFHIGGRAVTLSGLPEKELVFTPGAPPLKLNPNGDFEVEALYARYT
ncbi:MAG: esterase, partial [Proteobacteria bacterium]